jgi:hypothetical protein
MKNDTRKKVDQVKKMVCHYDICSFDPVPGLTGEWFQERVDTGSSP